MKKIAYFFKVCAYLEDTRKTLMTKTSGLLESLAFFFWREKYEEDCKSPGRNSNNFGSRIIYEL